MTPTRATRIHELISTYPFLLDMLAGYAPEFQKLRNPVARATLGRIATVEMAARMAGKDPDRMLADIATAIANGTAPAEPTLADAASRRETLKSIIRGLHLGQDVVALERRFDGLLRQVGPAEIGRIENELISEGLPVEEVHRLCDLHVKLFRPGLQERAAPSAAPGHPVHTFMTENRVFERACWGLEAELEPPGAVPAERIPRVARLLDVLAGIDVHHTRKEQLVFPLLERQGVSGPTQVMWAVDDELRALLKQARAAARAGDAATLGASARALARGVVDMIFKEESILFPMCLELFAEEDWQGIAAVEGEIGLGAVMPPPEAPRKRLPLLGTAATPVPTVAPSPAPSPPQGAPAPPAGLPLDTGVLSLEQIRLVFSHLPVELSFVDENDEVCFFSGGEQRIFPRSPQVIGRKVQNCHPPKSVATVNRILESFRAGTRDAAEFWLRFKDRLVHIRYFAVRDSERRYRGTLEVTQDVTAIQALTGERRLLDWEGDA